MLRRLLKIFSRDERGGVSTEFAITLAFLVFPMFIGTIDVSRLLHTGNILNRTAREAVVSASRGGDASSVAQNAASAAGLSPAKLGVTTTQTLNPTGHGTTVRVEISYNMDGFSLFPIDVFIPGGLTAAAEARME